MTLSVLLGSVAMPVGDMVCPRKVTCSWQKVHLVGCSFNPACLQFVQVITEGAAQDDDVIQVDKAHAPLQPSKN